MNLPYRNLFPYLAMLLLFHTSFALAPITLSAPDTTAGMPLMKALNNRKTMRNISDKPLPEKTLSNLLWAAFGVNRADGKRTAPSAVNWQETTIYVATKDGVFIYDAPLHALKSYLEIDVRGKCGRQPFVATAPVVLILVADFEKMSGRDKDTQVFYSAIDAGYISQNIYLFASSENLATVAVGSFDKEALPKELKLAENQHIILTQPIGYPQ